MRPLQLWLAILAVTTAMLAVMTAGGVSLAQGNDDGRAMFTNAQVVAIDVMGRTLVIRNPKGAEERVQLDDNLAGVGNVRVGDIVILGLRRGPGWAIVTSIARSRATLTQKSPLPAPSPTQLDPSPAIASRRAFAAEVASLAAQADRVDRLWNEFKQGCAFRAENPQPGVREWFAVWQGPTRADLSSGFCRDLLDQVIGIGEPIRAGLTAAEDAARPTLLPGEVREIESRYTMDWSGSTPPQRLER